MAHRPLGGLTTDAEGLLRELSSRWSAAGLDTAPADRDRAERALHHIYRTTGHPVPRITWFTSPWSAARRLPNWPDTSAPLAPYRRGRSWASFYVRHQVLARLETVRACVWLRVGAPTLLSLQRAARQHQAAVRRRAAHAQRVAARHSLSSQIARARHGQHDAAHLAFAQFFHELLQGTAPDEQGRGAIELGLSAGWWWTFVESVAATERPRQLHFDTEGRLHHEAAPAAIWPDGWSVWCWHGTPVSKAAIVDPTSLDPRDIVRERNLETRRVMVERYGERSFLESVGAQVVAEDRFGTLWRLPRHLTPASSRLDRIQLVEVEDATPTAGGERQRYWLRVPLSLETPRQAVAWTFGMTPEEYAPTLEA